MLLCPSKFYNYNLYLILPEAECDLKNYIKKYKLTLEDKIVLIYKILNAMLYFLEQGYNHSDIKPANILMINHEPKLSDFGLSFPHHINLGYSSTTYFSSPQGLVSKYKYPLDPLRKYPQKENSEIFNQILDPHKSDIFSLGILFYYILSDGKNLICKKYDLTKVQEKYIIFINNFKTIIKNKKEKIKNKYQQEYIKINETYTEIDIQKIKNNIVLLDNLFEIIEKMLQPNQNDRINLKKLISHPLFKSFHSLHSEFKLSNSNKLKNKIKLNDGLKNIFQTYKKIFNFNELTLNIAYNLFFKCQNLECDFKSELIFYCFYLANTISENRYNLELPISLNRVFKLKDYNFKKCIKCKEDVFKTICPKCNKTLVCNVRLNLIKIIKHVKGNIGSIEYEINEDDNLREIKIC
jgi:serine/threonine protein kinase